MSDTCQCFPGTCRGGELVNGRTITGARCKACIPAATVRAGYRGAPPSNFAAMFPDPKYRALARVLVHAYEQAACGKGSQRHSTGQAFDRQPILEIERQVGGGFCVGQAMKKAQESTRMGNDAAVRELLGAINYLAAAVIAIEEKNGGAPEAGQT